MQKLASSGLKEVLIEEVIGKKKPVLGVCVGMQILANSSEEGKESGQGVGYMDDGTMVVVENGKEYIGEYMDVNVTKVLQTAAGRMIFARVEDSSNGRKKR